MRDIDPVIFPFLILFTFLKLFHGALSVKFQSLKHLDFTLKTQELYLLLIEV